MKKEKKKIGLTILLIVALLAALCIYYYIALPPINIHSTDTWWSIFIVLFVLTVFLAIRKFRKDHKKINDLSGLSVRALPKELGAARFVLYLMIILVLVLLVGTILSSPIVNAKKYQNLMQVEERVFSQDISQADFSTIPILDKDSAALLGNRKMGSMVDMVSQFEVADDYAQINVNNRPVRVTPLVYASTIKWLTNQSNGIPAYIKIDMTTQDTECVKLDKPIRYSKSEHFNRNIYRHLRFKYPTYIFDSQIFFEIDDEGIPYWICPVKKFSIGLFGGQVIGKVVICNAQDGSCVSYDVEDVPQWVDKVYQAELLMDLYDYNGTLKHGFFNSVLGQKDCLQTTNGYNYIALDDDVWVYSGVTSVSGDQSNVGFVLMNQRTMETRFYKIEGAIEDSAMSSAEGQVQNLGYQATFPLILNIANEPTYFMALKDSAGLVKKYAMVNIQKYQWVAIGDTISDCQKAYSELLTTNGISATDTGLVEEASGKIKNMMSMILDGNTHIYLTLEGKDEIFDVDMTNANMIEVVHYQVGDRIKLKYIPGRDPQVVTEFPE